MSRTEVTRTARGAVVLVCATIAAWALWSAEESKGKVIRVDGRNMTPEAALKASRAAPSGTPRTIILRGGRYFLEGPLVITPQDSGLTIESAPGERAELNGGRRITGWRKDGNGPVWAAELPDNKLKPWRFRVMIVNGRIADRARLPEQGFFRDENPDWDANGRKATDEELTTLKYKAGDLGPWLDIKSAEMRVYRSWDESLSKVAWLDDAHHTARLIQPLRYPAGAYSVHKYEILNVREGLRAPGQWFLDYGRNKVYYWPRPGEDISITETWAPVTEVLVQIRGDKDAPVKDVCLRNLDLTATDVPATSSGYSGADYEAAITASHIDRVVFTGLRIQQVGAIGITINGTSHVRVLGCEFRETGACALAAFKSDEMEVADCRIEFTGHSTPSAAGMLLNGAHIHVHHNEVHDTAYSGISVDAIEQMVELNTAWRVMLKMADGSAFYTNGTNGVVRRNWAREVGVGPESLAPAYYLDDNTTGFTVEGNAALVSNWLLHVHNASANTFRENVFATSGDARITFQGAKATLLERNVIFAAGTMTFQPTPQAMATLRNNLLYSRDGKIEILQKSQRTPLDVSGNEVVDPGFVDFTHGDLRFQTGSAPLRLGVPQPPAWENVGPRAPALRR